MPQPKPQMIWVMTADMAVYGLYGLSNQEACTEISVSLLGCRLCQCAHSGCPYFAAPLHVYAISYHLIQSITQIGFFGDVIHQGYAPPLAAACPTCCTIFTVLIRCRPYRICTILLLSILFNSYTHDILMASKLAQKSVKSRKKLIAGFPEIRCERDVRTKRNTTVVRQLTTATVQLYTGTVRYGHMVGEKIKNKK